MCPQQTRSNHAASATPSASIISILIHSRAWQGFWRSWRETPSVTPLPLAPSIIIRTYPMLAWIHHHYIYTTYRLLLEHEGLGPVILLHSIVQA